jgi:hypothetical protein
VSKVYFGGSRSLVSSTPLFSLVVGVLAAGGSVSVGCAAGADALVVSAALRVGCAPRLSVFAVGSSSGAGFWSGSAPLASLLAAAAAGARVVWSAGGPASVPFRARLFRRSLAGLAGCSFAVFFSPGAGSLAVAAAAVARGLPVWAVCPAVPAAPAGCCGSWVACSCLAGFVLPCWAWVPAPVVVAAPSAQLSFF